MSRFTAEYKKWDTDVYGENGFNLIYITERYP
jgi:hypothetical protein